VGFRPASPGRPAPCFLPAYSPDLDPIDPSAGPGGFRQLSAGFSTKQLLLEPEAGFAQKHVAQNGPPNRRRSVGAIEFARLRSNRMPQLFSAMPDMAPPNRDAPHGGRCRRRAGPHGPNGSLPLKRPVTVNAPMRAVLPENIKVLPAGVGRPMANNENVPPSRNQRAPQRLQD
jgi:hypothetical protein